MKLKDRIILLAQGIGADIKALRNAQGDPTALNTVSKKIVGAINELHAALADAGAKIDDTKGDGATTVTWSADKIFDTIVAAKLEVKNELIGGASAAYDTFKELETLMKADATLATSLAQKVGEKVSFAEAQTLTVAQKTQACDNIGIGNPDYDYLADYVAVRDAVTP